MMLGQLFNNLAIGQQTPNTKTMVVSNAASHTNLMLSPRLSLGTYYDEISETCICPVNYKMSHLARHKASQEYRAIDFIPKKQINVRTVNVSCCIFEASRGYHCFGNMAGVGESVSESVSHSYLVFFFLKMAG